MPEEAKTIFSLYKFELVDLHQEFDDVASFAPAARESAVSIPSSNPSKQVKVTITSQTDLCSDKLNREVYHGMRKSMAESVLAKNAVQFFGSWCKHLEQRHNFVLPGSGVEIDYSNLH